MYAKATENEQDSHLYHTFCWAQEMVGTCTPFSRIRLAFSSDLTLILLLAHAHRLTLNPQWLDAVERGK